jgi:hypothetical protein
MVVKTEDGFRKKSFDFAWHSKLDYDSKTLSVKSYAGKNKKQSRLKQTNLFQNNRKS